MRPAGYRSLLLALTALVAGCGRDRGAADNANAAAGPAPAARPGGDGRVNRFVNSRANARSEMMRRHYADFSFDFPSHWVITPQPTDGSAVHYVRVAAYPVDGYEPFAIQFGYVFGTGSAPVDRREIERRLPQLARELGADIPNYRVTYMGPQRVGRYQSLGWRWEATAPATRGGRPARLYGRNDIVLPPGATAGVSISTVVSDRTPEADSQASTGQSSTTSIVYDSLHIGPPETRHAEDTASTE